MSRPQQKQKMYIPRPQQKREMDGALNLWPFRMSIDFKEKYCVYKSIQCASLLCAKFCTVILQSSTENIFSKLFVCAI